MIVKSSIDKSYLIVCDICGEATGGLEDFRKAVMYKKDNGWKSIKYQGEWQDICPECQEG
jgi:hypothetical protein